MNTSTLFSSQRASAPVLYHTTISDIAFYSMSSDETRLTESVAVSAATVWVLVPYDHADAIHTIPNGTPIIYGSESEGARKDRQYASLCQAVYATMRFARAEDAIVFTSAGTQMFRNEQEAEHTFCRLVLYFGPTLAESDSLPATAANEYIHRAPSA